jgi:hypothetical protein
MSGIRTLILASMISLSAGALAPPLAASSGQSRSSSLDEIYERLASRRNVQIERLQEYVASGTFPKNVGFPGQRVPYFVDGWGTPCAVGHLMLQDG